MLFYRLISLFIFVERLPELLDIIFAASKHPMDKIKPPKNFVLSWESMRAALDAFRAGQSVADATRKVVQIISPRSAN